MLKNIHALDYVVLLCQDIALMKTFYHGVLGFPIERDWGDWIEMRLVSAEDVEEGIRLARIAIRPRDCAGRPAAAALGARSPRRKQPVPLPAQLQADRRRYARCVCPGAAWARCRSEASAGIPIPVAARLKKWRRVQSMSAMSYCFVIVSSRLRMALATMVQVASSAGGIALRTGDSPLVSSCAASACWVLRASDPVLCSDLCGSLQPRHVSFLPC